MSRSFYQDDANKSKSIETPLVPDLVTLTDITTTTLSNGNQIYNSKTLDEWFSAVRGTVVHNYQIYKSELETQKSAVSNEYQSLKKHVSDNVLTDSYENQELLVPASVLAVGAFFGGRVLSNRRNWGVSSSLAGRIFTSIPSRMLLPCTLAGVVFSQVTPVTWSQAVRVVERDLVPDEWVSAYHQTWESMHTDGVGKKWTKMTEILEKSLQRSIRTCREYVIGNQR
ncbi:LAME_0H12750g1_1 [Lachancea meyersii CBS 8951]|uniref:LAME_0H12750g1_1 n=1 Tax=Lachancea meyersii CBS 8951 TaxID=1266667 RepID=A0A1G4KGU5_9SACH|nr:LAME_0H12750g1_1 [Lachancea meyersii CBS 8951]